MNILYLAHRLPYPPNKGDKIRSYHVLRHLAERHDVWCACFVDDPADQKHVPTLRALCREVSAIPLYRPLASARALFNLVLDEPASEGFYRDRLMVERLRGLCRHVDFDAALYFSSSMGQYADAIRARRHVIDFCDLDSRKWAALARLTRPPRCWMLAAEAQLLAEREHELYDCFDGTILISAAEARGWREHDRDKLHIVGNGVELPELPAKLRYDSRIVGFVGDMRYPPNVDGVCWFAQAVWPQVRGACPNAGFHVVGRGAPRRVRQLAAIPGVRVIGEVPKILPRLLGFQCVVAPLRVARGVQNKVLEAMGAGRPVVATPQAAEGIEVKDETPVIRGLDEQSFASRVIELLQCSDRCAQLGAAARKWVARTYRWDDQLKTLESILLPNAGGRVAASQSPQPELLAI